MVNVITIYISLYLLCSVFPKHSRTKKMSYPKICRLMLTFFLCFIVASVISMLIISNFKEVSYRLSHTSSLSAVVARQTQWLFFSSCFLLVTTYSVTMDTILVMNERFYSNLTEVLHDKCNKCIFLSKRVILRHRIRWGKLRPTKLVKPDGQWNRQRLRRTSFLKIVRCQAYGV